MRARQNAPFPAFLRAFVAALAAVAVVCFSLAIATARQAQAAVTKPVALSAHVYPAAVAVHLTMTPAQHHWWHVMHLAHLAHLAAAQAPVQAAADPDDDPAPGAPAPAPAQVSPATAHAGAGSYLPSGRYTGSGAMQQCIIRAESGGNSQIWNASGHYGLYQFSYSTWVGHGGSPSAFGHASVAQQNQVYFNTVAADGYSDWTPYDGC